ncbi:MAG: hypothetical protein OXS28_21340 [Gammaproteobacteria bacterium]|nr:hypothetical protein [Gammaproteobacteria bacterium]
MLQLTVYAPSVLVAGLTARVGVWACAPAGRGRPASRHRASSADHNALPGRAQTDSGNDRR